METGSVVVSVVGGAMTLGLSVLGFFLRNAFQDFREDLGSLVGSVKSLDEKMGGQNSRMAVVESENKQLDRRVSALELLQDRRRGRGRS